MKNNEPFLLTIIRRDYKVFLEEINTNKKEGS